ncbi:MAG: hypothetical protein K6G78_03315 [bacterium]|nr:hypothetical protein [bacterium]
MYDNATATINDKLYVFDRNGKLPNKEGWYNLYEEYTEADGTVVKEDYWVYSSKSGIATTDWKKISGYWYYFDQYGYMKYDQWVSDSKGECYLLSNGKMAVSKWIKEGTNWRYVDESGHMVKNTTKKIGGDWYTFDEDGYMISG